MILTSSTNIRRITLVAVLAFLVFMVYILDFSAHKTYRILHYLGKMNVTPTADYLLEEERIQDYEDDLISNSSVTKYIFDWTTFFGKPIGNDWMEQCPELNCRFTRNLSEWRDSEAVIFHMRDFDFGNLPLNRRNDQYFVFFLLESPHHTYVNLNALKSYFNLTISYRRDSDFYLPYGNIGPKSSQTESNFTSEVESLVKRKRKLVAWIVGHCTVPSKREEFVDELKKHIPVDIYGTCGNMRCSDCGQTLNDNYKFYLSFENSLCKDYTTEKLFSWIKYNIVPIVLSRKYPSNAGLPSHSVIAVDEFCSAKDLADYLRYLDSNLTAYLQYFQWRKKFESRKSFSCKPNGAKRCGFCGLCRFLLRNARPKKVLHDLYSWWVKSAECTTDLVPKLLSSSTSRGVLGSKTCYDTKFLPL